MNRLRLGNCRRRLEKGRETHEVTLGPMEGLGMHIPKHAKTHLLVEEWARNVAISAYYVVMVFEKG